eukprot:scaffold13408_cov153-Skeletonema_marinoi.AAC.5
MSSYRRVASADAAASSAPSNNDEAYGKRTWSERISDKIHALAWVVVAYCTASYTHFFLTLFTDDRIIRPIFNISMALFSINVILTLYLTIYLPCKFPRSPTFNVSASSLEFWGAYCPRVIPIMTSLQWVCSSLFILSRGAEIGSYNTVVSYGGKGNKISGKVALQTQTLCYSSGGNFDPTSVSIE